MNVRSAIVALLEPELEVQGADSELGAAALLEQLRQVDLAFIDLELPPAERSLRVGEDLLERLQRWPDAIRVLLVAKVETSTELPRQRHLAHLLLSKPPAPSVVQALKRAALRLPRM
ncbi:MAG TPA: hypothetical protein VG963_00965 [Polyangiaceae bacterium]|nr:hypothetical protein [Polyangiaceae bacterium]